MYVTEDNYLVIFKDEKTGNKYIYPADDMAHAVEIRENVEHSRDKSQFAVNFSFVQYVNMEPQGKHTFSF